MIFSGLLLFLKCHGIFGICHTLKVVIGGPFLMHRLLLIASFGPKVGDVIFFILNDLSSISHIYKSLYRVIFAAKYTGCLKFGHNHDQNLARVKANPLFTEIAAFSPKTIDGLLRTPGHSQTWTGGQVPGRTVPEITRQVKTSWYPSPGCMGHRFQSLP